jgi:hypothetical protein
MPSTVYLGEQMKSVPYSQYQSSPAYTGANSLWIKGTQDWTQYAVVPQGATVSLFAISPTGGSGSLTSDGQIYSNNYVFYPNSLLTFYAGTIGRHTLSFAINGQSSNQVVLDVVGGTNTLPSNNSGYYPGYNVPSTSPVVIVPVTVPIVNAPATPSVANNPITQTGENKGVAAEATGSSGYIVPSTSPIVNAPATPLWPI